MSTQQPENTTVPAGSQVASDPTQPAPQPVTQPTQPQTQPSEQPQPAPQPAPQPVEQPTQPEAQPGTPLGSNAPSVADLQHKPCPNCTHGVLYVTRYDPDADYERGQDMTAANQLHSGGAYSVYCFNCTYSESIPLNPERSA